MGTRGVREVSPNLWIPANCYLASQTKGHSPESQDSLAAHEQTEHSLGGSEAEDLSQDGQGRYLSRLRQYPQPRVPCQPTEPKMGHRYYLHRHSRRLGVPVYHPGSLRWVHRFSPIRK